jgi:hypothetical protein
MTDSANTAPRPDNETDAPMRSASLQAASDKFEKNLGGLVAQLAGRSGTEPVQVTTLRDWLLPLIEDLRDEYHEMHADTLAMFDAMDDEEDDDRDEVIEQSRVVVTSLVGLITLTFRRVGWSDANGDVTASCPPELALELARLKELVTDWAARVAPGEGDGGDDTDGGSQ